MFFVLIKDGNYNYLLCSMITILRTMYRDVVDTTPDFLLILWMIRKQPFQNRLFMFRTQPITTFIPAAFFKNSL